MIFYSIWGIFSSAFATLLLSITLYSLAKLQFVVKTAFISIHQTNNRDPVLTFCTVFWYFISGNFLFYQLISIALKSILVTIAYVYLELQV